MLPLGTTMGRRGLPERAMPGAKHETLSDMTYFSSVPSPISQPRMMMQLFSTAPGRMRAPEKMMQFSMLPSMMQLSATRLFFDTAFSP